MACYANCCTYVVIVSVNYSILVDIPATGQKNNDVCFHLPIVKPDSLHHDCVGYNLIYYFYDNSNQFCIIILATCQN